MVKTFRLGVTGTQEGGTEAQLATFRSSMISYSDTSLDAALGRIVEFHHGACIGADEQMLLIVQEILPMVRTIAHPPTNTSKMTTVQSHESRPPKPYLDRNLDIVQETEPLFAMPRGFEEELRSGTWSTIRRARELGKLHTIIWPDGRQDHYDGNEWIGAMYFTPR